MRVVIQRVSSANISIQHEITARIGSGLLILLGIQDGDGQEDLDWLVKKILQLRVFPDQNEVMNLSVQEVKGEIMVVSQFTLHASTRKGNRPSYIKAARPETAIPLYEAFIAELEASSGGKVARGVFAAMMDVSLVNTGPVTIIIDSKNRE